MTNKLKPSGYDIEGIGTLIHPDDIFPRRLEEFKKEGIVTPLYAIPAGFSLVPDEPTQLMLDAGLNAIGPNTHRLDRMKKYYKAMLKAAKGST